jgi:hypothetical protein
MTEWKLVFKFPDQSPSFAHGFTAARIWWTAMPLSKKQCFLKAGSASKGWDDSWEDIGDGWLRVTIRNPVHFQRARPRFSTDS